MEILWKFVRRLVSLKGLLEILKMGQGLCPVCGRIVRQQREIVLCGNCKKPVHAQCVDDTYCICLACLYKLGDAAKNVPVDQSMKELIKRKRKSMGL